MDITFRRLTPWHVDSLALRDDGVTLRVPSYGHNDPLPHDLAHFIVERELGLFQGFWGSVAAGCIFPGMAVLSGRQRPQAAERSTEVMRSNRAHVTQAEMMAGACVEIIERGLDARPAEAMRVLRDAQSISRFEAISLDEVELARLCGALRQAVARWSAVEVGGETSFVWQTRASARNGSRAGRPHRDAAGSRSGRPAIQQRQRESAHR